MTGLLVIDYKIDKFIKQIQKSIKDKNNKELEYQTIVNVLESQIRATIDGMAEGHTVIWKYWGTFVATKRRVDALNKKYISKGKIPTLQDTGLIRKSFKRNGELNGVTDLLFPQSKKDVLEVPDRYRDDGLKLDK